MSTQQESIVLMADDDADDRFLLERTAKRSGLPVKMLFVGDGNELMDYLLRKNRYHEAGSAPRPDLILLDLNMPIKGGLDTLGEIKQHRTLQSIAVVIWSTSSDENYVQKALELGACDYVVKPETFRGLSDALRTVLENCLGVPRA